MDMHDPQPAPHGVPAEELKSVVTAARKAKLTRSGIVEIAALLKAGSIDGCAAAAAAKQTDGHTATILLVSATMNGYQPDATDLLAILPLLEDLELMAPLIGACTGDRLGLLLDLMESERLIWEKQAFVILLAVQMLGSSAPPPRLLTQIRLLARECLSPAAGGVLGAAAWHIQDPATREVAAHWIDLAPPIMAQNILDAARQSLSQAPADVLPEREVSRFGGQVVRRAAPRTRRNDPCPCGSGRKYKKCCAEKDAARLADPSPVAGVTMEEYRDKLEQYLDPEQLAELSIHEVASLDFSRITTQCAIRAMRRLSTCRFWPEAERAMDVLAGRSDLPGGRMVDKYRIELIMDALKARAREVVLRQVAQVKETEVLESVRLDLELLTPSSDTLNRLEEAATEGMHETHGSRFLDLALALLDQFPALGILVARGALNSERAFDMEYMLDDVERARDRLQLPPGDLAHDLYESLIERDLVNMEEGEDSHSDVPGRMLPDATGEHRKLLREASLKVASLEKRLREQEELLRKAAAERKLAPPLPQSSKVPAPLPAESEEIRRLRGKVTELKGLISEGHKERSALRVRVAEATKQAERVVLRDEQRPRAEPDTPPDNEELDAGKPGRWSTLIPSFRNAARDGIRSAPAPLALQALQTTASLAAGVQTAWSGIKRLRRIPDVWSARIGLHHRLLFRLDAARGSLEVVAFIQRRDLETTIAKGNL